MSPRRSSFFGSIANLRSSSFTFAAAAVIFSVSFRFSGALSRLWVGSSRCRLLLTLARKGPAAFQQTAASRQLSPAVICGRSRIK